MSKPRLNRHIRESAVVIVVIKLAGVALLGLQIFESRSVDQEDVHPAVIVIVENRDTTAHRFHDVVLLRAAASKVEIDAGSMSYIGKESRRRRALLLAG